jgi:hypothetical protein
MAKRELIFKEDGQGKWNLLYIYVDGRAWCIWSEEEVSGARAGSDLFGALADGLA